MAKAGCDKFGSHEGLLVVGTCSVERCVWQSLVGEEVEDNAAQSFAGAEVWVGGGSVSNLFTTDSVLLVIESKCGGFNPRNIIQVMQRH